MKRSTYYNNLLTACLNFSLSNIFLTSAGKLFYSSPPTYSGVFIHFIVFGCSSSTTSPSNILKFLTFSLSFLLLLFTALKIATISCSLRLLSNNIGFKVQIHSGDVPWIINLQGGSKYTVLESPLFSLASLVTGIILVVINHLSFCFISGAI